MTRARILIYDTIQTTACRYEWYFLRTIALRDATIVKMNDGTTTIIITIIIIIIAAITESP